MVKDNQVLIDAAALFDHDGLSFVVRIKDVRLAYGQQQLLITPEEGIGSKWVSLRSLRDIAPNPKGGGIES